MELLTNPFFTLGATMRDDRRRIVDLAEAKSLVSDEATVRDATAVLTNPRRRLAAEIGWLPGLGPKRISEAISVLTLEPARVRDLDNLPSLARANLLADGLIRVVEHLRQHEVALWIAELAGAHDEIEAKETITVVNEERSVAGFPDISDPHVVDAELESRRQYYRRAIRDALDKLSPSCLLEVVTVTVEHETEKGCQQAPILIDDLVDSFEVEAQEFLEKERQNIAVLVQKVRTAVEPDVEHKQLHQLVSQLETVVRNWDRVAQPIQVSARSRGTSHDLSHEVAREMRSLAVDLVNEYGLVDVSRRLTALQQEVFAEVDQVVEQSEEDASTLHEIAEQQTQFLAEMEARAESWKREITYETDVGVMFKSRLRISPDGVEWKGSKIALEEIQRVRWGVTRHSVNGITTRTTYSIFVGGESGGTSIELGKQEVHSAFVDRLWKAAGVRLLTQMLEDLRAGKRYRFGSAIVSDYGVELERRKLFSANERVPCGWTELAIGNRAGTFYIARKDDEKVAVELAYQEMDNVHILEAALRVFWKSVGLRLSGLLDRGS